MNRAKQRGVKQAEFKKFIGAEKTNIYFVAFASLKPSEYTVVTEEISVQSSQSNIKLTDTCSAFNIKNINFI